jgi:hypothetical protein
MNSAYAHINDLAKGAQPLANGTLSAWCAGPAPTRP